MKNSTAPVLKFSRTTKKIAKRSRVPFALPAAALLALLGVQSAQATPRTWIGATGGIWGTTTNWNPNAVPASTDDLTILGPANVAGALNIIISAAAAANTINFTDTAAVTLTNTASGANQTLTLSGAGGITTGTGAVTIGSTTANQGVNIALGASQTWNVGAGGLTVNSVISGAGFSITKSGAGTLTLGSSTNSFSGGIFVSAGNLTSGVLGSLANNSITFNNSALSIFTTTGADSTNGGITLNGSNKVRFVNNNSSFSVGGKVTGAGGIQIEKGGLGSITVNFNATNNDFTGGIEYIHRQQNQNATVNVNSLADTSSFGTGNIVFGAAGGAATGLTISQNFNYGSGAIAGLTLTNRQFELATIQVVQAINNNSTKAFTINSNLLVSGTTGKILTLGGTGTGLSTFAGNIGNNATPTTGTTIAAGWTSSGLTSGFTVGSTSLMLASVEGIAVGAAISGSGIPTGTTVAAINRTTNVVTLSNGLTALPGLGSTITVTGVINSVQVAKAGTGTWVLSGANTFTGGTVLNAGTL